MLHLYTEITAVCIHLFHGAHIHLRDMVIKLELCCSFLILTFAQCISTKSCMRHNLIHITLDRNEFIKYHPLKHDNVFTVYMKRHCAFDHVDSH